MGMSTLLLLVETLLWLPLAIDGDSGRGEAGAGGDGNGGLDGAGGGDSEHSEQPLQLFQVHRISHGCVLAAQ